MERSGFVSISGRPNVGKSTLLNGFLKEKVAIISEKPETTRDNIRGILTETEHQIIFTDTPGIHRPHDFLGKIMLTRAQSSLQEGDIVLFVTDARTALCQDDRDIVERLPRPEEKKTVILVVNKVDLLKDKRTLLPLIDKAKKIYPFDEIVPVCALNGQDLERLLDVIRPYLPEGPFLYPEDQLSDKSERFMIQELIREKVLSETYREIPHSVAVVVDDMQGDEKGGVLTICATIYVERTSQKAIIIGRNGEKLKAIGTLARRDIKELLSRRVHLELWVKVYKKWKKDLKALEDIGYSG